MSERLDQKLEIEDISILSLVTNVQKTRFMGRNKQNVPIMM